MFFMEKALSKLKMEEFSFVIGKRVISREKLKYSIPVEISTMEISKI